MVTFIIPVAGANIGRLWVLFRREGRKEMLIRLSIVALLVAVWGYQAYEALVVHRERYFTAIERIAQ